MYLDDIPILSSPRQSFDTPVAPLTSAKYNLKRIVRFQERADEFADGKKNHSKKRGSRRKNSMFSVPTTEGIDHFAS